VIILTFELQEQLVRSVAHSYLFSIPPSSTKKFLSNTGAYRQPELSHETFGILGKTDFDSVRENFSRTPSFH